MFMGSFLVCGGYRANTWLTACPSALPPLRAARGRFNVRANSGTHGERPLNTDQDIERSIRSRLRTLPRIDESHIGIQVEDAIVTLTGFVGSLRERVEAECAAQRVASVLGIANEIQVAPSAAERLGDSYIVREAVA